MKTSSAKNKGRRLQQYVRDRLLALAPWLQADDVRSTSMGASGEDLLLSPKARETYPIAIECKNVEKINIWQAIDQAQENANGHYPVVIFKRNHSKVYAAVDLDLLLTLLTKEKTDEERRKLQD